MEEATGGAMTTSLIEAQDGKLARGWRSDALSLHWLMLLEGEATVRTAEGTTIELKRFDCIYQGQNLFPSISFDGRAIVFEREFEIWRLDTATGAVAKVPVALRGAPAAAAPHGHRSGRAGAAAEPLRLCALGGQEGRQPLR